jgi:putative flippase GtrA
MEGERFEYETNMLLQMKRLGIGFREQPITTVYDPEDYSSHYNAVKDSWRIFRVMARFVFSNSSALRYVISAVSSWIVDNLLYFLLFSFAGSTAAQVIARVLSSVYNFNLNRSFVFRSRDHYWKDMLEYYCVCVPQTMISVVLLQALVDRLSISSPGLATAVKILVDLVLFCISYVIQKKWVFREGKGTDGK